MAISPPSDLLLDVAAAADPAKVQAAKARLAALSADPAASNGAFTDALARARTGAGGPAAATATAGLVNAPAPSHAGRAGPAAPSAYTKFEAVLLQSFVESMLPKDDELFGDKNSAGVYRSMMAEQFANQIARAGGIGLARAIEKAHPDAAHSAPAPRA